MLLLLLSCTPTCESGFEPRDMGCYWVPSEQQAPPPTAEQLQDTLERILKAPLPDPLQLIERYKAYVEQRDESCPKDLGDGVWDTAGCSTQDGTHFLGKGMLFEEYHSPSGSSELSLVSDIALVSAATITAPQGEFTAGGITTLTVEASASETLVFAAVTGDYLESPAAYDWMDQGQGQSLRMDATGPELWLSLEGGVGHAAGSLYFDRVGLSDGCAQGALLLRSGDQWAELDWDCGCGTLPTGEQVCADLEAQMEDLGARLLAAAP